MKKRIYWYLGICALLGGLTGCAKVETASPKTPISLTVWHYYNGAQQASFDELISEFNAGEGTEKGIYVQGCSMGSVEDLERAITDSAAEKVGSQEMPDLFSTYADTAYAVQKQDKLTDLRAYFTEEEFSEYVDSYIQEGRFGEDDGIYLFPTAKSTEIMMINATAWETFSAETGASLTELQTLEGLAETAKCYYTWTDKQTPDIPDDGKAFYGRDAMSNYFIIGMKQMGEDLFEVQNGQVTICAAKEKMRRLWENYYVPYLKGYFNSIGKFRSDDVKTGDIIAYTGSLSSSTYFPDQVVLGDDSMPIDYLVLPIPRMEGGASFNVQQGASIAVTKSDEQHERAACEFLRWFAKKENNLRFVCESGYLPVKKEANSVEAMDQVIQAKELKVADKTYDCLVSVLEDYENVTFYTPKSFENGYATRKILDRDLFEETKTQREQIDAAAAEGMSREEAAAPYVTEEAFEHWYENLMQKLNEAAY